MNASSLSVERRASGSGAAAVRGVGGGAGSTPEPEAAATQGMVSEQQFQDSLDALVANEHNWMGVLTTSSPSRNNDPSQQHSSNPQPRPSTEAAWTGFGSGSGKVSLGGGAGGGHGTNDNYHHHNNPLSDYHKRHAPNTDGNASAMQDHLSMLSSHALSAFLQATAASLPPPQQPQKPHPTQETPWAALTHNNPVATATPTAVEAATRQQTMLASANGLAALLGLTPPAASGDGPPSGPSAASSQQVTFAPIHSAAKEALRDANASLQPPPSDSGTSNKRRRKSAAASSTSTSAATSGRVSAGQSSVSAVSEDEGGVTRQKDRNHREQQRSQHIAQQIAELRGLLSTSKVRFKPDKYSTLVTVADFIKSLQEKSEVLDAEHQKLLATIVQTTQAVNGQHLPPQTQGSCVTLTAMAATTTSNVWTGVGSGGGSLTGYGCGENDSSGIVGGAQMRMSDVFEETSDGKISPLETDGDDGASAAASSTCAPPPPTAFVNTLDYKAVFECCPVASAVTSIDGRFLDCNPEFEALSGFAKRELLNRPSKDGGGTATAASGTTGNDDANAAKPSPRSLSLFNVVRREHMDSVFRAMSEMLKMPFPTPATGPEASSSGGGPLELDSDYWSDTVTLVRQPTVPKVKLGVSLVRSLQGRPKFFSCTLLPVDFSPPIGEVVTSTVAVG